MPPASTGTSALGTRRRCRAWGKSGKSPEDVLGSPEAEVLRNQRSHALSGNADFEALGLEMAARRSFGVCCVGVAELWAAGD